MRTIPVLILLVTLPVLYACAGDFTTLSRKKPVTTGFLAKEESNVSFVLTIKSLKENRLDIFLNVKYVIGNDTLNDYLYLDESYSGTIKEIFLQEGDSVSAFIYLNNEETAEITQLKGSLMVKKGVAFDMQTTGEECKFTGTVWKADQLPLFRIAKSDEKSQLLHIDVGLTGNYEFDKLYLKIKIISPAQGILLYTKDLVVVEEPSLPLRPKIISIDFPDLDVQKQGSYYVQVFHQMGQDRINGVESVAYRLTDK